MQRNTSEELKTKVRTAWTKWSYYISANLYFDAFWLQEPCTFLLLVILFDLLFKTQLFGISKLQHSEVTQCCLYWVHHFQTTPPSYGLRAILAHKLSPSFNIPLHDFSYDFIVLLFVDCLSAITISPRIIIIYILHTNILELCVFNYFKFFTQSRSNLLG